MKLNLYMVLLLFIVTACQKPTDWLEKNDGIPPGVVKNVRVENVHGGAKITYDLPDDNDLMGVKVQYALTEGEEKMEKYASADSNLIELEGYGHTSPSEVTLFAVDNGGNVSPGVSVTIEPLSPPISLMRETLSIDATFGGVSLSWENEYQKEMGISLFVLDSTTNEMRLVDNYFSASEEGRVTFRGFGADTHKFEVVMFDRWNNYADNLVAELTPLKEDRLPGRIGSQYIWSLFDDANWLYRGEIHNDESNTTYVGRTFHVVHDGVGQNNNNTNGYWNPGNDGMSIETYIPGAGSSLMPFPLYFTMDMGRPAVYSRFNIKSRLRNPDFSANLPVDFEIWATNDPKRATEIGDGSREANQAYWTSWPAANGTDAWKEDGWVKIATCKLQTEAGESKFYDGMLLSDNDLQNYRTKGFDFDVNEGVTEGYRYLRWVIKDTNTGMKSLQIAEMEFWGTYTD